MRDYKSLEDENLFELARAKDAVACTELYNRHNNMSVQYVQSNFYPLSDRAQELVHEVFYNIIFSYNLKQPLKSFLAYFHTALKNDCIRRLNRDRREDAIDEKFNDKFRDNQPDPLDNLLSKQRETALHDAIKLLNDVQREIIKLVHFEHYSVQEAADILEIDLGVAKSRLFRAREQLRKHFNPKLI